MRRAHKLLSLLLVLTLALSLGAPVGAAYSDTSGHWAEDAIDRWSAYGIVSGDGDGFDPDGNLTRSQMAKILAEALGLTKQAEENPFADVAADAWYTPYVLRCYEAGIMQGDGVNANPDAPISREEAMVMLCRALGIVPASEGALSSFSDGGSVSSWAAPYVAAMVQSGVVNGVGNNTLVPAGNISRASLMTILDRSVVQYINEPGSYELTDKAGIVLVAAGDVTLTGTTSADVLVSPAADGKAVAFDKATVTGSVTVQAEDVKVTSANSTLPDVSFTGEGGGEVEPVKPTEPTKPSTGGGSSGGGSSSHTHTWNEGEVTTAATCTAAGVKTYTCTGCSQTKTETIEATGHTPAETYTTDETGHWHVCTVCGEPADKTAHTYPEGTDCASAATCTVEGCGYTKAGGTHIWGEGVVTKAATCTEAGTMTYTCTLDDGGEKAETIPALGHNYAADFTVDTEATCTAAGSKSKHCSRCDSKTDVTAIEALGHDFSGAYLSDETNHWHKCSRCDATDTKTAHTWNNGVESGETITFTCTVCSKTKTESVPTEKQVAVPTNYKLVLDLERRAASALSLEMTKPSAADLEKMQEVIPYQYYINGTKSTLRNLSQNVGSTIFLLTYSGLTVGENTIRIDITVSPTDAAKAEGYIEGTTSFTATITLTEGENFDTSGVSAELDDSTLTISGLDANQIYEVRSSDGKVTGFVYTGADGTATKANVTGEVSTLSLWKLTFSDVTDTTASLTRCAASAAVAVTIKTTE